MRPDSPPSKPVRLWAAGSALLAAMILCGTLHLAVGRVIGRGIERFNTNVPAPGGGARRASWLTTDLQVDKLKGVALAREVYRDAALLPVYGSSELTQPQDNRADTFFEKHPTGFGAFLLGNPGETCLIVASKLAAAGPEARGKKAVVFLSPGWFFAPELDHAGFGVNFSPLHGGVFAFERSLSAGLKQDLSRRLLDYPETVGQNLLLANALKAFAQGSREAEILRTVTAPLGRLQNQIQREMDYARLGLWWWRNVPPGTGWTAAGATLPTGPIDWRERSRQADAAYTHQRALTSYSTGPRTPYDDARQKLFIDPAHPELTPDDHFARACLGSKEWTDYELLLRTARELKMHLLVVCQPLNAKFCRLQGLTDQSPTLFYEHLVQATVPYKTALVTFPDEERDPHFYRDSVHPSGKAWIAYDQALDRFYHQPVGPDGF